MQFSLGLDSVTRESAVTPAANTLDIQAILDSPVDLDKYCGDLFLSQSEIDVIREYEGQDAMGIKELLETEENGHDLCMALLKAIKVITEPEPVRYALALMWQVLSEDTEKRVILFKDGESEVSGEQLLTWCHRSTDSRSRDISCKCLALFIRHGECTSILPEFLSWVRQQLVNWRHNLAISAVVSAVMDLSRSISVRETLVRENSVELLSSLLSPQSSNKQLIYEICFSLWAMSYSASSLSAFCSPDVLDALVFVLCIASQREKIIRVTISALLTALTAREEYTHEQLELQKEGLRHITEKDMLRTLIDFETRKWTDEDLDDQIQQFIELLRTSHSELSSIDRYEKELDSGVLSFNNTLHSETFWKENAKRMEKDNYRIIKRLVKLLHTSRDNPTIAVCCHDLGEYIRFVPEGKVILDNLSNLNSADDDFVPLDTKSMVMGLLASPDAQVREHALMFCSKMLVHNWEAATR
eukprot:TRINITY_DN779869_c0_g1_i1.p1 TRINITY_DN779869_c0_g1~~TRINITY_DN779869_c0_g1_i1.p1  ORF type:complete len:472 (+),score=130.21 TRINITY_DN779869_c0_g1_i1:47-1462(+)